jgi:hypothetical protein
MIDYELLTLRFYNAGPEIRGYLDGWKGFETVKA